MNVMLCERQVSLGNATLKYSGAAATATLIHLAEGAASHVAATPLPVHIFRSCGTASDATKKCSVTFICITFESMYHMIQG